MEKIKLLRPHHWVKNLFLFVPLFFSGDIFNLPKLMELTIGFFAFSLVASCIYVLNDLKDIEADRMHPKKCKRPLASGAVSKPTAYILLAVCFITGAGLAAYLHPKFLFITGVYFCLNLSYSLGLKHVSILDVIIVAIGFVLRVKAGGAIASVHISIWLTIMVFLLALFMAVAKRRDDVKLKMDTGKDVRKASANYNMDFLNVVLALISAITIVAYLMYTVSPHSIEHYGTHRLYHTCLFVIGGIFRYLQITYVENNSGSPTHILYKDRFLQLTIVGWVLSFYFIIYFNEFEYFIASLF
ncbi:decaprenyl-phosphate phosphoribosyltransferase [Rapidithrix thailandica]|uniref:Decaprenyl-phosphate phosphoribosyltransferase n=1 Tax=Rapidithrix thailandica TaxID=413964 RepID=A0AAW9S0M4_9BACT